MCVNFCSNLPSFAFKPSYNPGLQVCSVLWTLTSCIPLDAISENAWGSCSVPPSSINRVKLEVIDEVVVKASSSI